MIKAPGVDAGPFRPFRPVNARWPDPARIALATSPGAVTGASALHAGVIADQDGVLAQGMTRGTELWHGLRQFLAPDAVMLGGQSEVARRQHENHSNTCSYRSTRSRPGDHARLAGRRRGTMVGMGSGTVGTRRSDDVAVR